MVLGEYRMVQFRLAGRLREQNGLRRVENGTV